MTAISSLNFGASCSISADGFYQKVFFVNHLVIISKTIIDSDRSSLRYGALSNINMISPFPSSCVPQQSIHIKIMTEKK